MMVARTSLEINRSKSSEKQVMNLSIDNNLPIRW